MTHIYKFSWFHIIFIESATVNLLLGTVVSISSEMMRCLVSRLCWRDTTFSWKKRIHMVERLRSRELIGKVLISDESGKKFGVVGDLDYITESGELINLVLTQPTKHATELNLQQDDKGRALVPFAAVRSVGDFVIVSEKDVH